MNFNVKICSILLLAALCVAGFVFVKNVHAQGEDYSINLSLTKGEDEVDQKTGGKYGRYYGTFTSEGFMLGENSMLTIENLPKEVNVAHVHLSYEARGLDDDLQSLRNLGREDLDGVTFNIGRWHDWKECSDKNFFIQTKKSPKGMEHMWSNSMNFLPEWGIERTAVPGANVGDNFQWNPDEWYKIEIDIGPAGGTFHIYDSGGKDILKSPAGLKVESPMQPRDNVFIALGAEPALGSKPGSVKRSNGPSYADVTLRNFSITLEDTELPPNYKIGKCVPRDQERDEYKRTDDPDNPYDTCACQGVQVPKEIPCEDPIVKGEADDFSSFPQFPFHFDDAKRFKWDWKLPKLINLFDEKEKETAYEPWLNINFGPPSPKEGEDVTVVVAPMSYRTSLNSTYQAFCLTDESGGWTLPMNSVIAGGKWPEVANPSLGWADGACCQPIIRKPAADVDSDGMDDTWEAERFLNRGFAGINSIYDVRPEDDPDHDGYFANRFKNDKGQYVTVAPSMRAIVGGKEIVYPTGGADAVFTNIEEYIAGTNPTNADTDGDGVADEMDYQGSGQMTFSFDVKKPAGPDGYYDITATSVGITQAKKVGIASGKKRLFVGDEGKLEVALRADKDVLTVGSSSTLELEAQILTPDINSGGLYYKWIFDGESICETEEFGEFCDVGRNRIELGGNGSKSLLNLPGIKNGRLKVGDNYTFSVEATDPDNRKRAEANMSMPIGAGLTLTNACDGEVEGSTSVPANSPSPVKICILELLKGENMELSKANFIWEKDNAFDQKKSGLGKFTYDLEVTKPSGEKHNVGVRVKDAGKGKEIASGDISFLVAGPEVKIVQPEERFEYSDPVADEESRFIKIFQGETMTLTAELRNFMADEGWEVTWAIGDEKVLSEIASEKHIYFDYTASSDISPGTIVNLTVMAKSVSRLEPEEGMDTIRFVVVSSKASAGNSKRFTDAIAAAFSHIPLKMSGFLKFGVILASVFLLILILYPFINKVVLRR
ncbi:MAG: hypothetical protein ACD_63C00262G0007 [uncultured bacterium]|nr:MAG: hypothetical protein ACD_63C00262G0007 [uncultured bacterium]